MSLFSILCLAMCLDALLGEPRWLWDRVPHPAILMGRAVTWLDARLNAGGARRIKGIAALMLLCAGALATGWIISLGGAGVTAIAAAILLAQKSLMDHVRAVADALRLSLGDGRRAVAQIVGRDVSAMNTAEVSRGAIESAAENFSDGVIAPIFWFLVAGLPGLVLYKAVNTADSMIGYRTDKYAAFGWASARFDDLLNLIPARLSGVLIAGVSGGLAHWQDIKAEAPLHRSPNAGWPESALARALGVALSGPRAYHGTQQNYPFVNAAGLRDIGPDEIDSAVTMLWRAWAAVLGIAAVFAVIT